MTSLPPHSGMLEHFGILITSAQQAARQPEAAMSRPSQGNSTMEPMPTPANAQDAEERATPTEKRVIRHQPIQLPRDGSFNPDDILRYLPFLVGAVTPITMTELNNLAKDYFTNVYVQLVNPLVDQSVAADGR